MTIAKSFLFFFLLAHCPILTLAWGTTGHEIVANIAWNRLNNLTQDLVTGILGPVNGTEEAGSPLAAVADWADQVRFYKHWSAPLHYIDVRDDLVESEGCHIFPHLNPACRFCYTRDCPNDICVAGAIVNYSSQLLAMSAEITERNAKTEWHLRKKSQSQGSKSSRKEALMFLTHFVGDIHQPLHCSRTSDKGGNDLTVHFHLNSSALNANPILPPKRQYRDPRDTSSHHSWNLHSVWDTGLIDLALARDYNKSRTLLEHDLMNHIDANPSLVDSLLSCPNGHNQTCTEIWGQESWQVAISLAYTLDDNITDVTSGDTITEEYYETRWPMVMARLMGGGLRLAATLEHIFSVAPEGTLYA